MTLQWNASYTNPLYLRAQIDKKKSLKENLLLLLLVGSKPAIAWKTEIKNNLWGYLYGINQ